MKIRFFLVTAKTIQIRGRIRNKIINHCKKSSHIERVCFAEADLECCKHTCAREQKAVIVREILQHIITFNSPS